MGAKQTGGETGQYGLDQNADINVTPFVDVLLVLLIIFMLAIPLATVSIKLDLPLGDPKPNQDQPVFVSVLPHGEVYVGERQVSLADLDTELSKALNTDNPREAHVGLKADRSVRYADFLAVLNTLQSGGFTQVGLITENLA
jgi:biopolymer transport protein ExbD